jgi:hypothetical protein
MPHVRHAWGGRLLTASARRSGKSRTRTARPRGKDGNQGDDSAPDSGAVHIFH